MNRITTAESLVTHSSKPTRKHTEVFQGTLVQADSGDVAQSMFLPMHYEQNYAYPLVVWLHGDEDDERQLHRIMPHLSMRNYIAAAPRGLRCVDHGQSCGWKQTDDCIEHAHRSIAHAIEQASCRTNINPRRIMLVGFGSGATMAMRVALATPDRFAGVVSIGGPMPRNNRPLAGLAQSRRVPVLICQGRYSQEYADETLCDDLRLLHIAGFSVTLRQYPCGDDLVDLMLRDANCWLMDRVTGDK